MKRVFLGTSHLIALLIATVLLWSSHLVEKSLMQNTDQLSNMSWFERTGVTHPWTLLILTFLVCIAISRLQEIRWGKSLSQAMVWPVVIWALSLVPSLSLASGERHLYPLGISVLLIGYLLAGLVLFKGKEIGRRNDSSGSGKIAQGTA